MAAARPGGAMAEEPTLAELGWRMAALERQAVTSAETIEHRFDRLQRSIDGLSFVRSDVYTSDQRALAEKVESAARLAMWAIGLVATTAIGAIVLAILGLSGVFK